MNNKFLKIIGVVLISLFVLIGCNDKDIKKEKQMTETNGMLSYTIDGEKTDIKPSKEEGYIVNKIICDNGSDIMWDNDNWEVELTRIDGKDRCKVDFTKDVNIQGYRVTVTSNMPNSLDSLSKATTLNGTVKIYSTSKIESITGCNGVIEDNKVIVNNVNSNQTCNITIEDKALASVIKIAYPPEAGRTDFSIIDSGAPTLYTGSDDQGTTYYFSGNGTNMNNWVSFAGKMWRIIRINGNGSVRLLYSGSNGTDATDIGSSAYYSSYGNPAYVGWKYTVGDSLEDNRKNSTKSNPYLMIENWYNTLDDFYINYIDLNTIYCNDRELSENSVYNLRSFFYYTSYERLVTKNEPSFKCNNVNDRFNTFGLMTADEIVFAGGLWNAQNELAYYYLAKDGTSSITGNRRWWTMSPYYWDPSVYGVSAFCVKGDNKGSLSFYWINDNEVLRPVLSLKPEVLVNGGDGSANSPYEVILP